MSIHDENVKAIVNYFKSGIKDKSETGKLGIEIEHVVVGEHSRAISYSEEHGVRWILEQLSNNYPNKMLGDEGDLLGLAAEGKTITLEPAAQLELSTGPYEYAAELQDDYSAFQHHLVQLAGDSGMRAVAIGYHPTAKADDLELIPKQRYRFMDDHFAQIGPFGRCMMRGSAATQISIDYYSVDDCLRKLRLASAAAPLLALICDNSPTFEGEPSKHHLVRTKIWNECDPARCGTIPGVLSKDFTLEAYAEYILRTPAIFYFDDNGTAVPTEKTFGEVFEDKEASREDVEHMLSLFFNDARCKTYVEIRPADALPLPYIAAYASLIKGMFYFPESLDRLDQLFEGVTEDAVMQAKESLMESAYDGTVYGNPAGEMVDELFDIAKSALPPGEAMLLIPLSQLAKSRKTLAMMGKRSRR